MKRNNHTGVSPLKKMEAVLIYIGPPVDLVNSSLFPVVNVPSDFFLSRTNLLILSINRITTFAQRHGMSPCRR